MRRILQTIAVLTLAGAALAAAPAARAQGTPDDFRLSGSVGLYIPTDAPAAVDAKLGVAASLRTPLITRPAGSLIGALHFATYEATGGQRVYLLLPSVEYAVRFGNVRQWTASAGLGPLFAWNPDGNNATDLGLTFAARYRLSRTNAAELRYTVGSKDGESGVTLSLTFPLTGR